jgi:hypothetical protein
MKTTGEDVWRQMKRLLPICLVVLSATAPVEAQSVVGTNWPGLIQQAYSAANSVYVPSGLPGQWRAFSFYGMEPVWVSSDMLQACTNSSVTNLQVRGVTATPIVVTEFVLTGDVLVESPGSTGVIVSVSAPSGYVANANPCRGVFWEWSQATGCPDCYGLTAGEIPPPTVTFDPLFIADIGNYSVYASNMAAQCQAAASSTTSSGSFAFHAMGAGGGFMAMDDDDMDDDDSCSVPTNAIFAMLSISQDTNAWTWLVAGPTCTNYLVGWFSTDALSTNTTWVPRAGGWAGDTTTTWADTSTTNIAQQFYRAIMILPTTTNSDWNGDGIPDIWEADQGLNPFDPNTASETSTNPWAHGLTNLQVYENPSVLYANNYSTIGDGIPDWWRVMYFGVCTTTNTNSCAVCDPDGDGLNNLTEFLLGTNPNVFDAPLNVIVNGGNPYTLSLTISIQTLSTNYPNVRISTDPVMSNATVAAFSDGIATYTLSDNGDGLYNLYLQYADAAGQPHGVLMATSVTLDRLPPVVQITSPASNAVLNQAFITLQAVAADPNPVVPDAERPLSIWINGQPFWDRNGTNITIERFPVPSGTNSFTATILAVDLAGNTNYHQPDVGGQYEHGHERTESTLGQFDLVDDVAKCKLDLGGRNCGQ